jgi:hypothetical protein
MLVRIYEHLTYLDVKFIHHVSLVLCAWGLSIGQEYEKSTTEIPKKKLMKLGLMMVIFTKN